MKFPTPLYAPETGDLNDPGVTPTPTPEPTPEPVVEPDPAPPAAAPTPSIPLEVFNKRVSVLTAQKRELEEKLKALAPSAPLAAPAPDTNIEALAQQRALELNRVATINSISNGIAAAGHEVAPDFLQQVGMMSNLLGVGPEVYVEVIHEAAEGDPKVAAQLLYYLAKDPTRAGTVFALPPLKQVLALTKMAKKESSTPARSATPAPIVPRASGRSQIPEVEVNLADKQVPIDAWMAKRDAEARARRR